MTGKAGQDSVPQGLVGKLGREEGGDRKEEEGGS